MFQQKQFEREAFPLCAATGYQGSYQQAGMYGKWRFKYLPGQDIYTCPERNHLAWEDCKDWQSLGKSGKAPYKR